MLNGIFRSRFHGVLTWLNSLWVTGKYYTTRCLGKSIYSINSLQSVQTSSYSEHVLNSKPDGLPPLEIGHWPRKGGLGCHLGLGTVLAWVCFALTDSWPRCVYVGRCMLPSNEPLKSVDSASSIHLLMKKSDAWSLGISFLKMLLAQKNKSNVKPSQHWRGWHLAFPYHMILRYPRIKNQLCLRIVREALWNQYSEIWISNYISCTDWCKTTQIKLPRIPCSGAEWPTNLKSEGLLAGLDLWGEALMNLVTSTGEPALKALSLYIFYFGHTTQLAGSQFPDQGLNPDHGSESPES